MKPVVFLDRDGTLNQETDNLQNINDLKILPSVVPAVRKLNGLGCFVAVITNQPVVARGWITEKELDNIHKLIIEYLGKEKARIDAIYYCPHHPNATLPAFRKECEDRKPNTGLIKRAVLENNLLLDRAFFVGDSTTDMKTALNARISPILVKTGYAGKDGRHNVQPEYTANDLFNAAEYIEKKLKQ